MKIVINIKKKISIFTTFLLFLNNNAYITVNLKKRNIYVTFEMSLAVISTYGINCFWLWNH